MGRRMTICECHYCGETIFSDDDNAIVGQDGQSFCTPVCERLYEEEVVPMTPYARAA